ncbi:MAG: hypothetical protein V5A44_08875 [Haloarculaceae archaeon]
MCHEYTGRAWNRERTEDEEETPSFLNEEGADDVEVVTDGGEEE